MAHAYLSAEDDQIVISDEPRTDLEALARWQEIDVDEAQDILDARTADAGGDPTGADLDEDAQRLLDYLTEHNLTSADVLAALTAAGTSPAAADAGEPDPTAQTPPAVEAPAGNASTEKWAEYARSLGVEVEADAGRDAIKAAIDAHEAAR